MAIIFYCQIKKSHVSINLSCHYNINSQLIRENNCRGVDHPPKCNYIRTFISDILSINLSQQYYYFYPAKSNKLSQKKKMSLKGKLISQTEIKGCKDLFHEMFKNNPHHLPNVAPQTIQAIDLHEGNWGTVDAVINCNTVGNIL